MTNEQKFEAIRARALKAAERIESVNDDLRRKYGTSGPPSAWLTRTEDKKREAALAAQSKAWDAMFDLLDRISPRSWRSGVAAWWVVEKLTYADAITSEPLSELPQAGYGTTQREVEYLAGWR